MHIDTDSIVAVSISVCRLFDVSFSFTVVKIKLTFLQSFTLFSIQHIPVKSSGSIRYIIHRSD